jgi:hypothetical protein
MGEITTHDAVVETGVSYSTLLRRARLAEVPHRRVDGRGGPILWDRDALFRAIGKAGGEVQP